MVLSTRFPILNKGFPRPIFEKKLPKPSKSYRISWFLETKCSKIVIFLLPKFKNLKFRFRSSAWFTSPCLGPGSSPSSLAAPARSSSSPTPPIIALVLPLSSPLAWLSSGPATGFSPSPPRNITNASTESRGARLCTYFWRKIQSCFLILKI